MKGIILAGGAGSRPLSFAKVFRKISSDLLQKII
jgi:dTDP-glucose pyrophosphorylase